MLFFRRCEGRGKQVSQVTVIIRSKAECDDKIDKYGKSSSSGKRNIESWIPQLTTDVLFCADASLSNKTGVCQGDSGGPAIQRFEFKIKLDRGSIRSSPTEGLSTPYRLTKGSSVGLFHHVHVHMGDLNLVYPALNLFILDAGILIMVQQVGLMMFSLNMVDYSMSFLSLST